MLRNTGASLFTKLPHSGGFPQLGKIARRGNIAHLTRKPEQPWGGLCKVSSPGHHQGPSQGLLIWWPQPLLGDFFPLPQPHASPPRVLGLGWAGSPTFLLPGLGMGGL